LALDGSVTMEAGMFVILLSCLTGAAAGASLARLSSDPPSQERFARIVRRQLLAGRWVILVRGVPWERQDSVVTMVRERSVNWSAVSGLQRWL
jgi:hypothetical protein